MGFHSGGTRLTSTPRFVRGILVTLALGGSLGASCGDDPGPVGPTPDTTPPTVIGTTPTADAASVSVATSVSVTFSEAIDASSWSASTVQVTGGVSGSFSVTGSTGTFTPSPALDYGSEYSVTVGTGVRDLAGNTLRSAHTWSFGTEPNVEPVAVAGAERDVVVKTNATLDGTGSSDANGQALTYTWTQVFGTDVTGGAGSLSGVRPTFTAPELVGTVVFALVVSDGLLSSAPDTIQVNVVTDLATGVYASPSGNDSNDGTRASPLRTIAAAIALGESQGGGDVYLAAGSYGESVTLRTGVSLYGGFDPATWLREPSSFVTHIDGGETAIRGSSLSEVRVDGLTIRSSDATVGSSIGIRLTGSSVVVVSNNVIVSRRGADGANGVRGTNGSSGGMGSWGQEGSCDDSTGGAGGAGGTSPNGRSGGAGGAGGYSAANGSAGSAGGGASGGAGGAGGAWGAKGSIGSNGADGASGISGTRGGGGGPIGLLTGTGYRPLDGLAGGNGTQGFGGGGGGGGGGQSGLLVVDGRGNGGGGGGGAGTGGTGGGAGLGG
ncbi:MAG: Ig-like domain-containing protein, partial [Gemmatimonadota bacterium]|nr:Ig-like domain-containing protein [Gemmatimonadota bacterium]